MRMFSSDVFTTGLAIFSMLFGAGNLIYPLIIGMTAGNLTWIGMIGFLITAAILPLLGLVAMILFDGDYQDFFGRLGYIPSKVLIFLSLLIIGPVVAIPRIVTLSHVMIAPFIPIELLQTSSQLSSALFACIFLGLTFLASCRENKIIDILGKYISPILLASLAIIIAKGFWSADSIVPAQDIPWNILIKNIVRGYETLDLLGAIFFASIILSLLKAKRPNQSSAQLAAQGFKSGILGVFFLCLVYIGMSLVSMFHSHGMTHLDAGALFREISFHILGNNGAIIISLAVLMACLSTAIALVAVFAEYIQQTLLYNRISYVTALLITLVCSMPLSIFGLSTILEVTGGPIVYIGYPVIITITVCNIAYKLFHFNWIKLPVLIVFIATCISYWI